MALTIRQHEKLYNDLVDKSKADLDLDSPERVRWICGRKGCKGWICPVFARNSYPEVIRCCRNLKKDKKKCEECDEKATHNYPNMNWPSHCPNHFKGGMVSAGDKCAQYGCGKNASYNYEKHKRPLYCISHRDPSMVDVHSKRCAHPLCNKQPAYNLPGLTKMYCGLHKKNLMINVTSSRCKHENCGLTATYSYPGKTERLYCKQHSPEGTFSFRKKCEESGCNINASFNYKGSKGPRFCQAHKLPSMEGILGKRCYLSGCGKRPTYGYGNQKISCKTHKDIKMDYIGGKSCVEDGCDKFPIYNYKNKKPMYCSLHRLDEMEDVFNVKCLLCDKQPNFNYKDEKPAKYCFIHKEPSMIDVRMKKCEECTSRATCGIVGQGKTKCRTHVIPPMVVEPNKMCLCCTNLATRGIIPQKVKQYKNYATHCEYHMPEDQFDIHSRKCNGCGFNNILDRNGMCYTCDPSNFSKHIKAKEMAVKDYFDTNGIIYKQYDTIIEGGECGRERPDFLFDYGTHFTVCEIDESQHSGRECDRNRMFNIHSSLGLPVTFIRYNPDRYCFSDQKGRTNGDSHLARMEVLTEWIKYLSNPPSHSLGVVYLFFDGWTGVGKLDVLA